MDKTLLLQTKFNMKDEICLQTRNYWHKYQARSDVLVFYEAMKCPDQVPWQALDGCLVVRLRVMTLNLNKSDEHGEGKHVKSDL